MQMNCLIYLYEFTVSINKYHQNMFNWQNHEFFPFDLVLSAEINHSFNIFVQILVILLSCCLIGNRKIFNLFELV